MGSCYAKRACDIARAEIGYQGDGKWCKYSEDLDSISYFNFPKNGAADWCSIFVNWCVWKACIEPSADDDPEGAKWTALYMMYEPEASGANAAAGCTQAAEYFKSHDAWTDNPQCGDQVFYQKSNGALYHTGILVDWDWDNDVLYVVEGNTGGSQVLMREYSFKDIGGKIAGFGRPRYDGKEFPTSEKTEEPVKEDPKPVTDYIEYTVNVGDFLNIRTGPSSDEKKIGELYGGAVVRVYEKDGAWGRIGGNMWVCMDYLD